MIRIVHSRITTKPYRATIDQMGDATNPTQRKERCVGHPPVFASSNSATMTITESGEAEIKGIDVSSTADNIELSASVGTAKTAVTFSVIWVTLSFRNSGKYSDDDDDGAAVMFAWQNGDLLGNDPLGTNKILIKGTVTPDEISERTYQFSEK